ncbi:MAG: CDP-diacylglycerol--glycerol-3-phosphate 3-phosphatidyltransferase [Corynebacterium sp.]|uniref:CDP-diacylglycerol--glycerol-3-phosphate 3-phosphatidyltransferase n=1 Tax=Corynebacterium TaxID=1716 RepID=UPI002648CCFA|nr:CDP-diacylglycerol--glycerol-3-phosphate 3-phosphatidyltransferase [Corynebacterium sp.]MDN5721940.1 CDP-diacylglycerol--glycerol-3-phosphate 3-phosphatidyltransferase [Corynebacterium sp.]MDN6282595.1 CDP-diacylglycerol--glycerol-3-phosphate 3-phosphatidyltransferase [Corynebacterium sp.]MDN6306145.1 CDP-diacylglycerol--glycerol-3-phosphate 3-phosphatidyltransferase [Corynebacterium sp.]MDN6352308.1 CDP-diacylglycerol--glycerol-3-phosphate 3-phosphatidyltransferase [Corynebacterium sp.]MDN
MHRYSIPNVLTTIRIALIPIFVWLLVAAGPLDGTRELDTALRWWALFAFCLLMITDQLDGHLARKYEVITDYGKLADPIADKALMISAMVTLNILGDLWWWVTVVIVVRELGITVWRMVLARRGKVVPASKGGKLKTVLQTLAIAMVLAPLPDWTDWITIPLVLLAVAVTVVTGIQYLLDSRNRSDS